MIIASLQIENFGVFRRTPLEFGSGLHFVSGPNEAGKSTLLQLLRETLFGFAVRNRYVFEEHASDMACTARVLWRDGQWAKFRRRKGQKNVVSGAFEASGEEIDEKSLARLLGGASLELYKAVFAFSQAELAESEKNLAEANLRDTLYGASAGGLAGVVRLQRRLAEETQELFVSGRRTTKIKGILDELQSKKAASRATRKGSERYAAAVEALEESRRALEARRKEVVRLQRQDSRRERLESALPAWLDLQQKRRMMSEITAPEGLAYDAQSEYGRLKQRLEELEGEVRDLEREASETADELSRLVEAPAILAAADAINELHQKVELVRGFRRDIPLRQGDAERIQQEVERSLRDLHPQWGQERLNQFKIGLAQREAVERMQAELSELERTLSESAARREVHKQDLAEIERQLRELPKPEETGPLETLLSEEAAWRAAEQRRNEHQQRLQAIAPEVERLAARVGGPWAGLDTTSGDPSRLVELATPLRATVDAYQSRLEQLEKRESDLAAQGERVAEELKNRKRALADEQRGEPAPPDRKQLESARAKRDGLWRLVRGKYIEESLDAEAVSKFLSQTAGPEGGGAKVSANELPSAYERAVERADTMADERQERAEQAARCEQIHGDIERLEEELRALRAEQEQAAAERREYLAEWNGEWRASGLAPRGPAEMLEWLGLRDQLAERLVERKTLMQSVAQSKTADEAFAKRVRGLLGTGGETAIEVTLREVKKRTESARTAEGRRTQLQDEASKKEQQLARLEKELERADESKRNWQTRWTPLLEEFGFPAEWDVHFAVKVLRGLAAVRGECDKASGYLQRVMEMQRGLDQFTQRTAACLGECGLGEGSELAKRLPQEAENAVVALKERLDEAVQADRERKSKRAQREQIERKLKDKRSDLADAVAKRQGLFQAAGTTDEAEFMRLAAQAVERKQLADHCKAQENLVAMARAAENAAEFEAELARTTPDALASAALENREALLRAEGAYETAVRDEQAARLLVGSFDDSSEALAATAEVERLRGQLVQAVEAYAPRTLASLLLAQAAARFERTHQPAVLGAAKDLFSRLTGGRYVDLRRQLDEEGTLLVEEAGGRTKTPEELSTGTREQLYLAIRLAYVRHYCEENEPLPLVMDDVLVNFDAERAQQTLRVLGELGQEMQILFLTCHQHTLELARQSMPQLSVSELGQAAAAAEVTAEGTKAVEEPFALAAAASAPRKRKVK